MWVLIVLTAYYNPTVASVDFFTKEACQFAAHEARNAAEKLDRMRGANTAILCVPKGKSENYDGWQTQTEKELCRKLREAKLECF